MCGTPKTRLRSSAIYLEGTGEPSEVSEQASEWLAQVFTVGLSGVELEMLLWTAFVPSFVRVTSIC